MNVPTSRRVVAALGPKVLKLAAQRSAGAHPYLTTPEHTAQAREVIGKTVFLAPEHKVVLTTDADEAREIGRKTVDFYLNLSNYLNNWKRLGFTDEDIAKPGSDKLIDAVVAHGTPERHRQATRASIWSRRRPRGDSGAGRLGQAAADADRAGRTARAEGPLAAALARELLQHTQEHAAVIDRQRLQPALFVALNGRLHGILDGAAGFGDRQ